MKEKIVLPYAPILVESTRSIGYSFETALADIIDNSIGKNADEIHIRYDSNEPQYVAVLDNGTGMEEKELVTAMRYGSKSISEERDINDLGRFGLGLKMSSMSQCRILTVISKQNNKIVGAQWDLDHIINTGDWTLKIFSKSEIKNIMMTDELDEKESGTLVIWQNFDRMLNGAVNMDKVFDEKIYLARKHISLVFHRFEKIKIYFNNDIVNYIDPFLTNHPATQPLVEQNIIINKQKIRVKPYVLPYKSKLSQKDKKILGDIADLSKNQGFYVYRNKRLIIWGTWFRIVKQHELNKLARVLVDIPSSLDFIWDIDIKKSRASLPEIVKKNLASVVINAVGRSESVYKYRGRKTNSDGMEHIWNVIDNRGTFQYMINRDFTLYSKLESCMSEEGQQYLDSFIKIIENTFPFEDVYYRLAKNDNSVKTEEMDFEEVYKIGTDMLDSLIDNKEDAKTFLENMKNIDFFAKYPEVINKIMEDYDYVYK